MDGEGAWVGSLPPGMQAAYPHLAEQAKHLGPMMQLKRPGVSDTTIMANKQVFTLRTPAAPALPTLSGEIEQLVIKMGHTLPAECIQPVQLSKIKIDADASSSSSSSSPGGSPSSSMRLLSTRPQATTHTEATAAAVSTAALLRGPGAQITDGPGGKPLPKGQTHLLPSRLSVQVEGCSVKVRTFKKEKKSKEELVKATRPLLNHGRICLRCPIKLLSFYGQCDGLMPTASSSAMRGILYTALH